MAIDFFLLHHRNAQVLVQMYMYMATYNMYICIYADAQLHFPPFLSMSIISIVNFSQKLQSCFSPQNGSHLIVSNFRQLCSTAVTKNKKELLKNELVLSLNVL